MSFNQVIPKQKKIYTVLHGHTEYMVVAYDSEDACDKVKSMDLESISILHDGLSFFTEGYKASIFNEDENNLEENHHG